MFTQSVIDVLCRNHAGDVERLNRTLSTTGTGTLVPIPPHTYVGRVGSRQPEEPCVLLLGINPMYSERPEHQEVNVHLPQRCLGAYEESGDLVDLRDLYEFQEGYFLREERNKRHFSKFGHWFGRHWFPQAYAHNGGKNAQNVLDRHVVEMDVLQYFSRTASINGDHLLQAVRTDPALIAHWSLLEEVLQTVKPQWIQVHGKSCWKVMEALLMDGNGERINPGETTKTEIIVGRATVGDWSGPVLMHKFLGMSGPQKNTEKALIAGAWDDIRHSL